MIGLSGRFYSIAVRALHELQLVGSRVFPVEKLENSLFIWLLICSDFIVVLKYFAWFIVV